MIVESENVFSAALALPQELRAALADQLIASLNVESGEPPLGASDAELQSRLDAIARGEYEAVDRNELMAKLRLTLAESKLSRSPQ